MSRIIAVIAGSLLRKVPVDAPNAATLAVEPIQPLECLLRYVVLGLADPHDRRLAGPAAGRRY